MFREERELQPFNEICHFDANTLNFALALRKEIQEARIQSKRDKKHEIKRLQKELHDRKQSTRKDESKGRPKKDKFTPTESGCHKPKCLAEQEEFRDCYIERQQLLLLYEDAQLLLKEAEAEQMQVNAKYEEILKIQAELQHQLLEETDKYNDLKPKFHEIKEITRNLQREVTRRENEKVELQTQKKQDYVEEMNINFIPTKGKIELSKKHTGVLGMNDEGLPTWSCCQTNGEYLDGCIDDQSIDIKAKLKNGTFYNNQLYINHPLQHGSSMFSTVNQRLSENGGYLQRKQRPPSAPILKQTTNNSIIQSNQLSQRIRKSRKQLEMEQLQHESIHNSSEYFSIYKPQVIVEQQEPHFHQIKTTGIGFGSSSKRNTAPTSKHNPNYGSERMKAFVHTVSSKVKESKNKSYLHEQYLHNHPPAMVKMINKQRPHTATSLSRSSYKPSISTAIPGGMAFSHSHVSFDFNRSHSASSDVDDDVMERGINIEPPLDKEDGADQNALTTVMKTTEEPIVPVAALDVQRHPSAWSRQISYVSGGRSVVGKVRTDGSRSLFRGNRPMTSPSIYQ